MRKRLLDASSYLFLKQGYETIRVGDIIKAAGVSRATFYTHFAGKDAALRELMTEVWDRARERERYQEFAQLPDWSESSIRDWLEHMFDSWTPARTSPCL